LNVAIDGWFRVLAEDSLLPPVTEAFCGSGIRIVLRAIFSVTFAQNDSDQVIRARAVVAVLHRGSDLVIRLGSDFSQGDLGCIVAKRAKGFYVGHKEEANELYQASFLC